MAKYKNLTAEEKIKILELKSAGETTADIAKKLDRGTATIERCLSQFKETAKGAFKDLTEDRSELLVKNYHSNPLYGKILNRLVAAGLDQKAAAQKIGRVMNAAAQNNYESVDAEELYNAALSSSNVLQLFGTTTQGGRDGITVMTTAASQYTDSNQPRSNTIDRNIDGERIFPTR